MGSESVAAVPRASARMPTTSIRGALSLIDRAAWCTAVSATAPAIPETRESLRRLPGLIMRCPKQPRCRIDAPWNASDHFYLLAGGDDFLRGSSLAFAYVIATDP